MAPRKSYKRPSTSSVAKTVPTKVAKTKGKGSTSTKEEDVLNMAPRKSNKRPSISSVAKTVPTKVAKTKGKGSTSPMEVVGDKLVAKIRTQNIQGNVLVFGDGVSGQLGLTMDVTEKPRPCLVPDVENIIDIAAGGMHTVCLTKDYQLITFGCNDEGALGRDTNEEGSEAIPGPVTIPGNVVQISAGDSHTAALLDSGLVYVFGTFRDSHGSLGLLERKIEKVPILLDSKVKFTKVASGCHHLVLLGVDGNVYTFGCGEQGQLGRVSERVSTRDSRQGPSVLLTPAVIRIKRQLSGKFVDVWAGSYNTFAKDKDGKIYVFGLNNYKQLGIEENLYFHPTEAGSFSGHQWTNISGGEHHTLALTDEGEVYVLGRKEYGRLGLGENCEDALIPTKVEVCSGKKIIDISCGSFTSFALTEDGQLYSWGMGSVMLGVGDEEDLWSPTLVKGKQLENRKIVSVESGGQHTVILTKSLS